MPIPPAIPFLDGVPGRRGADVGNALLWTLTQLYVQQPTHTLEEERHYCELAERLIERADAETRAAVAAQLASYAAAPRAVLARLAQDLVPVHAALPPSGSPRQHPAHSLRDITASDGDTTDPAELSALFAAATAPQRRAIVLNLDFATACSPGLPPADAQTVAALDTLALQRRREEFASLLARLLRVSPAHGRAIVQDAGGECIVVALKALRVPMDVLQRVLLFLNPAIGHSVQRVYDLAGLHAEVSARAAQVLVAIWQVAHPASARPVRHVAGHWRTAARLMRGQVAAGRPVRHHTAGPYDRPERGRAASGSGDDAV